MFSAFDHKMMSRAIALAKKGRFTTAPNPNVGCVIVNNGQIVGEGFHYRAGLPHAEVFALRAAGDKARGATAYVTLEPCSHYGRTPPCALALIEAGISRVVCAMVDPNPKVAGNGVTLLQNAGVTVEVGLLEQDAKALNLGFIKAMQTGMPYVQLKMASSLDGRTALANGESKWITGPQARADVQHFRAQAGAILSTSATVIADDPSMNIRWQELPFYIQQQYPKSELRLPIRVIIDSQNRLSPDYQLFHLPGKTLLARCEQGDEVWPDSVTQLIISRTPDSSQLDLHELLQQLVKLGIYHIWVEAGAGLAGALVQNQLVDSFILYQAPKLMGAEARGVMNLPQLTAMGQVPNVSISDLRMVGTDIRITADIHSSYAPN
ncbi:bifunctional diaminohydroxyphosphoribosylaminopyrimidine deaminase/5-amino-6-(5-phosphoribosylamino)uracil reductase RibD [Photobacterium damselae]|uniref:Riboflavin biosynthesis protein RibD n=2 Tax=Photobacterium damselae TaxID=38293 RepID=D0YZG8_PHODD|nr:bifunctional diaminohydroxyphosphoribosylaminopyrimidine deaminase/5-amino-6-(5-phosphoribosylamino)uracil reductase RibD [Photobacterium damselae]EEZ41649.1 diaminohydroxyphosphoribosylaminopyrimidine deaminase/5-amino-6-(5-phosphoribosylamino)uracil reductase [Photobacterium damselae subsp. damselae CIP 102761]PSW87408.1 bifunctional diaminohydroxyphosphoribosylaminopyrimidine deaminase/5-amino-6-(5-phosphoribosylamino)uracil reductase [Photobacterium damselae]SPY27503.1 Riboflavin biosynth